MKSHRLLIARNMLAGAAAAVAAFALGPAAAQTQARATNPGSKATVAWAAKPASLAPYTGPNRLIYRLADVLAAHKGQTNWQQKVFLSRDFEGDWISMAPGQKTKTQFYADDRVFWVVQSGAMKVTNEGQQPFVATKHFLVQVPKRLQYSMETVGNQPVLYFQMKPAGEAPDYPLSQTPTPVPGVKYVKAA
jgi:mannose-6-phosphate isomerase-like protein (cupin superfamily)